MAVHLNRILARFAGTAHAQRARKELIALGPQYANGRWMATEVRAAGNPLPVAESNSATVESTDLSAEFPDRSASGSPDSNKPTSAPDPLPSQPDPESPSQPTRRVIPSN